MHGASEERGQIRDKANKILAAAGGSMFQGGGQSSSLAKFAIDHGNIWVPLEFRE